MMNVLLVDDEPWVIEGLRSMVDWENHGFQICGEAMSGPDALQMIERLQPELVVTDIHMPVLNGLELVERSNQLLNRPPKFIILSGYDDFNYAHCAIKNRVTDYLLKPIDEEEIEDVLSRLGHTIMEEKLIAMNHSRQRNLFVNNLLNRLIQGEYHEELGQQALQSMNLRSDTALRCVLVDAIAGPGQLQLREVLREYFPAAIDRTFMDYKGRAGIILPEEDQVELLLEETGHRLYKDLSGRLERPVIVAISDTRSGIQSIRELYLNALEIGKSKRCQARVGVFSHCPSKQADEPVDLFKERLTVLTQAVLEQDIDEIAKLLDASVLTMECDIAEFGCVKTRVADLELTFYRRILDMNGEADRWLCDLQMRHGSLSKIDNYAALKEYIRDMSLGAASMLGELRLQNKYNTVAHVIQYVDQEFRNRLQLQDLAKHFHMNATYLGQRFKKETGKTFNEYVNDKRIAEAKCLLKRSNKKILEVALEVGFPNADYFVSKFKQSTGILPSVFKQEAGQRAVE